jgi:hypothetical protein
MMYTVAQPDYFTTVSPVRLRKLGKEYFVFFRKVNFHDLPSLRDSSLKFSSLF